MSKTLILPAEMISRELDARLLQGVIALDRGWEVITGSKALINRAIWKMPPSVYLCQTLTHKRLTMLRLLKRLGHVSFGWDEEGLVYFGRDVYLMRRVSSETLEMLSGLVAWGRQSAEDLAERSRVVGLEAHPFGNPRFDLLRPELDGLHEPEVRAIRQTYGDFILINTNYSSLNPIISMHDAPDRRMSKRDQANPDLPKRFEGMQAHRKRVMDGFLAVLKPLAERFSHMTIVVRPHPGEEMQTWVDAASDVANLKVVREGGSIPWLKAAKAMVHNGCTTGAEAAVVGHTPIAYCPEVRLDQEAVLCNAISHRAETFDSLCDALSAAIAGKLEMGAAQRAVFNQYVSGVSGPLAAQQIMDLCERLHDGIGSQRASVVQRNAVRIYAAGRHAYKSMRKGHRTDRYLNKVFPEISCEHVAERANLMAGSLGLQIRVDTTKIGHNIFKMTAGTANRIDSI